MKHFVFSISLLWVTVASAQQLTDTLSCQSKFSGVRFYYLGEQVKAKQVMQIMENDELALDEFSSAREAYFFGSLFAILGGVLIGYPFVNKALDNKVNYSPAFAGVCFVGISIPIFRSHNKKARASIILYNSKPIKNEKLMLQGNLYFGSTPSGIGLHYKY